MWEYRSNEHGLNAKADRLKRDLDAANAEIQRLKDRRFRDFLIEATRFLHAFGMYGAYALTGIAIVALLIAPACTSYVEKRKAELAEEEQWEKELTEDVDELAHAYMERFGAEAYNCPYYYDEWASCTFFYATQEPQKRACVYGQACVVR